MSKNEEMASIKMSKYAAKKAALAKVAVMDSDAKSNVDVPVEGKTGNDVPNEKYNRDNNYRKREKPALPPITARFPEHVVAIALLLKNNAEIRRFTALGILNYLMQKGEISGDSRYVSFKWNKFAVKCNGLMREFTYNEPFFLNALVASFSSFSASAQRIIDNFCRNEIHVSISKAIAQKDVDDIVALNDKYQQEHENVVEDANED